MGDYEVQAYSDDRYKKSNFLISSKYASTLLENKLTAISLAKIEKEDFTYDSNNRIVCKLSTGEIKKILDVDGSGNFYAQLSKVADHMTGRTIGMSDPENKRFMYMSVMDTAKYENGVFSVYFNPDFKKYIQNLKNNYTILELPTMMKFKSVYSFRLYEILRSKSYYPKGTEHNNSNKFMIHFKLSELKLNMGIVNAELDVVRDVLKNKEVPDYDKAVEKSPERKFEQWRDFKRKVLDVATKEINEKTNMHIEYETIKEGRGGKVTAIDFITTLTSIDEPVQDILEPEAKILSNEEMLDFLDNLHDVIPYSLKIKDLQTIAIAANYDMDVIKKAVAVLDSQKSVDNVVGFLLAAIKNDYDEPIKKKKKSDIIEHKYSKENIDELQKKLLNMQVMG